MPTAYSYEPYYIYLNLANLTCSIKSGSKWIFNDLQLYTTPDWYKHTLLSCSSEKMYRMPEHLP
jgi:hypothetical protein